MEQKKKKYKNFRCPLYLDKNRKATKVSIQIAGQDERQRERDRESWRQTKTETDRHTETDKDRQTKTGRQSG
jgi:hypothetical protein